jgi:hypothetical protein
MGVIVLVGIILTFATSVLGFLAARDARKKVGVVDGKVAEVHVLVNQQLTDVVTRVSQLTSTLEAAGVAIPDKAPGSTAP